MTAPPTRATLAGSADRAPDTGGHGDSDTGTIAGPLRLAVGRLSRRMRQESNDGFSLTQLGVLASLHREGPRTLGALAATEQVAPPTITKAVSVLTDRGLLEKVQDPDDKRVCRVVLSAKGRREVARINSRRDAWLATRLDALDPDDRARLARILPLLQTLADDETAARTEPVTP